MSSDESPPLLTPEGLPTGSSDLPSKPPSTVSEWQLLAVLHRSNLLQYYDVFIDLGGDDVNQILYADESEFREIMSIVGMLEKPLHVERLQVALAEYGNDPNAFCRAAIPHIGAPPVSAYSIGVRATDPAQPLQYRNACTQQAIPHVPMSSSSSQIPYSYRDLADVVTTPQLAQLLSNNGGTANVMQGDYLQYLMENNQHSRASSFPLFDDFVELGDFDPNSDFGTPILSDAQIVRLTACSQAAVAKLSPRAPKFVQNKKKISQDVLNLMVMHPANPNRTDEFRKYSAIYGRFGAKNKADKVLTLHQVSVNEAAAQICMLVPALLTRRDELFALSRQVVKDAGYLYMRGSSNGLPRSSSSSDTTTALWTTTATRKRMTSETPKESDESRRTSTSPLLNVVDDDPVEPVMKRASPIPWKNSDKCDLRHQALTSTNFKMLRSVLVLFFLASYGYCSTIYYYQPDYNITINNNCSEAVKVTQLDWTLRGEIETTFQLKSFGSSLIPGTANLSFHFGTWGQSMATFVFDNIKPWVVYGINIGVGFKIPIQITPISANDTTTITCLKDKCFGEYKTKQSFAPNANFILTFCP